MSPRPLIALLVLVAPLSAQREDELMMHWRLDAAHYTSGAFRPVYGQPPLVPEAPPKFVSEGESQALSLPEKYGLVQAAGRIPSDVLPQRRFTVEGWVLVDKPQQWGAFLGAIEDNGEEEYGWMLGFRGDKFCFGLATEDHGKLHYLNAPGSYRAGNWYHVAGVYDGSEQRLYVNGKLASAFEEHGGPIKYERDHLLVCGGFADKNEKHPITGGIYELRVWNKVLSERDLGRRVRNMEGLMPVLDGTVSGYEQPKGPTVRDLQPAINQSIDRGVAWLLARQFRDGSFASHWEGYPNGATSLALYTLVKQGVPVTHPAIQNGLRYLKRNPPKKTYSAGCQLMLLAALEGHYDEDELEDWALEIVDLMVDWENGGTPGSYGYPGGHVDLSNTQYAALGLWAAHKLGIKAPKELWHRLVLTTCEQYQGEPTELEWEGADKDRTGKRRLAGFTYRPGVASGHGANQTGSMTTAGLCIIGTARIALKGNLGRAASRPAAESERMALEWLAEHWTVDRSPGGGQHLYYLYGVERVAAFYGLEKIGNHDWYRDGAQKLIKMQAGGGDWGDEPKTCFSLLFLARATASSTGPGVNKKTPGWTQAAGPVHFRVTGDDTLAFWITAFDKALLEQRGEVGLRVVKVDYVVNGEVVATAKGDPKRAWKDDRLPGRHRFDQFGKHQLEVHVHVLQAGETEPGLATEVIKSHPITVDAVISPEVFQRMNLVEDEDDYQPLELDVSLVEASTMLNDNQQRPDRAVDGMELSRWETTKEDAFPWLRIQLREPVRAKGIRISPGTGALWQLGHFEQLQDLRVIVNGDDSYELTMPVDGLGVGELELPREERIRSLEIRIDGRAQVGQKTVGIAEVKLLGKPPRKRRGR